VARVIPEVEHIAQAIESITKRSTAAGIRWTQGEDIPLYGRIIAVADAYANMTSDRSFAPPRPTSKRWGSWKAERHAL